MAKVFISYRREDSADICGRLYDRLTASFGVDNIFKDVDSIPLGQDFRKHLDSAIANCDVILVVIGDKWMGDRPGQELPRLMDQQDFVRIEVSSALRRQIPIIPLLAHGTVMPDADSLPEDLRELAYRNAACIRRDPDFHRDVDRIITSIEEATGPATGPDGKQPAIQDKSDYSTRLLKLANDCTATAMAQGSEDDDVVKSIHQSLSLRQQRETDNPDDPDDLWNLIVAIAKNRSRHVANGHPDDLQDKSQGDRPDDAQAQPLQPDILDELDDPEPTTDFAAIVVGQLEVRVNRLSDPLRRIALWKLAGYSNQEIAHTDKMDCALRTVDRKLALVRKYWRVEKTEQQN